MAEDIYNASEDNNIVLHGEDDSAELDRSLDRPVVADIPDETEPDFSEAPEISDESFENLAEMQLAQIEEEVEAERQLSLKRKRDKEKALKRDKRAFQDAHDKHERDLQEENLRYARMEEGRRREEAERVAHQNDGVLPSESDPAIPSNPLPVDQAYSPAPVAPGYPNAYSEAERRRREAADEVLEEQRRVENERTEALFERFSREARERQQQSENYNSFGSHGIDYSGNQQHSAYAKTDESAVVASIDQATYAQLRENYEHSREHFRSYGDGVPDAITVQYQEAADRFFSVQRKIDQGMLVVSSAPAQTIPSPSVTNSSESLSPIPTAKQFSNSGYRSNLENPQPYQGSSFMNPFLQVAAKQAAAVQFAAGTQSGSVFSRVDTSSGAPASVETGNHHRSSSFQQEPNTPPPAPTVASCGVSQARFENLQRMQAEAQRVVDSYEGKNVPAAVSAKAEKLNRIIASIQNKMENPAPAGDNASQVKSQDVKTPSGGKSSGASSGDPSFAQGTQVFSDRSKVNYGAGAKRTGDSHIKPVGTPVQASPISKYDRLKIYNAHNFAKPFEVAGSRTLRAVGGAIIMAARRDETGTADMMVKGYDHGRTVVAAAKVLMDSPRQLSATFQGAANAAHTVRNAARFLQGKEALAARESKALTIKQIDKQLKNPFTSVEKEKLSKKFGSDINQTASKIRQKTMIQTASNKNLKSEIKALQAKGASLSSSERKQLKALMDQKKAADAQLRKLHGLKNAQAEAAMRSRQADSVGKKSAEKTLRKTAKKNLRLTKKEASILDRMKDRNVLLDRRNKLQKARFSRKQLLLSLGGILGSAARESEESSVRGLLGASRFVQNRYVRSVLRHSTRIVLKPAIAAKRLAGAGLKKLDNKLGVSAAVKKSMKGVEEAAVRKLLHSRPYKALHGGLYNKAKTALRTKTPPKIKTLAKKSGAKVNSAKKKAGDVRKKYNKAKSKVKSSKVGRAASKASKAAKKVSDALKAVKGFIIKAVLIGGAALLLISIIGAFLSSVGGTARSTAMVSTSLDGRLDLMPYVEIYNKEMESINQTVADHKANTEDNDGKYKKVYVDYIGGAGNNNFKEIMCMTTVFFDQDFSSYLDVSDYMTSLFWASNYVTTSESDVYYCSGCEERDYYCYWEPDEYATDARKIFYATHNHTGEAYVGEDVTAQKGCQKSPLYSCMERGHGTYNSKGCYQHNDGWKMNDPGDCNNYTKVPVYWSEYGNNTYQYSCQGHCSGKHYDYSCPGHTEKICKGHIDLYVNVVSLGLDKIFNADPGVNFNGVDIGNYEQGRTAGSFNITYYCAEQYPHICNAGPPYKTASGTVVTAGRTIAVDPDVIPLGTKVLINGHLYVAEDTGGAIKGNRIDIAVATHQEALDLGRDAFTVYYANEKDENSAAPDNQLGTSDFAGWTEDNRAWVKDLYKEMTPELYAGLTEVQGNGGSDYSAISLDGLVIQGSKIEVTYYSQHDSRWAQTAIRSGAPDRTISTSGCGFTSMAIVVSSLTSNTKDPVAMCKQYGASHYVIGSGAAHSLIPDVSADYGLSCTEIQNSDMQGVVDALKDGKLVVALVGRNGNGWTGNGYYRGNGHFLVICGVTEDGDLLLADPNRPDVAQSGQPIGMEYFVASGIKNLWVIGN